MTAARPGTGITTFALTGARKRQREAEYDLLVLAEAARRDGWSYPHIGELIGLTPSGARDFVARARRRLA